MRLLAHVPASRRAHLQGSSPSGTRRCEVQPSWAQFSCKRELGAASLGGRLNPVFLRDHKPPARSWLRLQPSGTALNGTRFPTSNASSHKRTAKRTQRVGCKDRNETHVLCPGLMLSQRPSQLTRSKLLAGQESPLTCKRSFQFRLPSSLTSLNVVLRGAGATELTVD